MGPVTNLLSALCILMESISRTPAKGKKGLNDFRFGTSIGHFQIEDAASAAVKGLILVMLTLWSRLQRPRKVKSANFFFLSFSVYANVDAPVSEDRSCCEAACKAN